MPEASVVRRMFEGVAPRYDLLNRILSLGIDRSWRRGVVSGLRLEGEPRVLDLCCGTGDLAIELSEKGRVVACDFTWNMLVRAKRKSAGTDRRLELVSADALALPFAEGSFEAVTVAFGIRNLENMARGLEEMRRVLSPGGTLSVLEFSHPHGWLRRPYELYLNVLLPRLGDLLSRRGEAYRYLAETIMGFPEPETLASMMRQAGFHEARYERLSGGIVAIHRATR